MYSMVELTGIQIVTKPLIYGMNRKSTESTKGPGKWIRASRCCDLIGKTE